MDRYENYDGLGLAELVRSGETNASELLDAALERVDARDGELGALVLRSEDDARAEIEAGLPEGPFTGVPWLLKARPLSIPGRRLSDSCRPVATLSLLFIVGYVYVWSVSR